MSLLRAPLLTLARSERVLASRAVERAGERFVGGADVPDAVRVTGALVERGVLVSLERLGAAAASAEQADRALEEHLDLLHGVAGAGVGRKTDLTVPLAALGAALPHHGEKVALEHARAVCRAARDAGASVTLDPGTSVDQGLSTLRELRKDFPETGIVLHAALRRTPEDCRGLAYEGSRVRLCRGGPSSPAAYTGLDADLAFVRGLKSLMAGQGHPCVATHDPMLTEIALALAARHGRPAGTYELQLHHGVRPAVQRRLADHGETVRVHLPYGPDWRRYLFDRAGTLGMGPRDLPSFLRPRRSQRK